MAHFIPLQVGKITKVKAMINRTATFKKPDVMRAVSCALSLGLIVKAFEIGPDGAIIVHTSDAEPVADSAVTALEKWKRGRNG